MIPKKIMQMGNPNLQRKNSKNIELVQKLHPDFEYVYFNDTDIVNFIKEKCPASYLEVYQKLPKMIQKYDFFRYIYLYMIGGFYFDLDVVFENPIDTELLALKNVVPTDTDLTSLTQQYVRFRPFYDANVSALVGQYALGAERKSKFMKFLVDQIIKNVDEYITHYNLSFEYVLKTTGPDFVTQCLIKYKTPAEVTILPKTHGMIQDFGKYAIHSNIQSWI